MTSKCKRTIEDKNACVDKGSSKREITREYDIGKSTVSELFLFLFLFISCIFV